MLLYKNKFKAILAALAKFYVIALLAVAQAHSDSKESGKNEAASVDAISQELITLNRLISHTYIDALLFLDGELRSEEGVRQSISDTDKLLQDLASVNGDHQKILPELNMHWKQLKDDIDSTPEKAGYSYYYLERVLKSTDKLHDVVDDYLKPVFSMFSPDSLALYQANTEVLTVVSMHLSSATMDIGNDDASLKLLEKNCQQAAKSLNKVVERNPKVKSFVLRSWNYIEGPICKTRKKGGNFTISHFGKKISNKLDGLRGSRTDIASGGL